MRGHLQGAPFSVPLSSPPAAKLIKGLCPSTHTCHNTRCGAGVRTVKNVAGQSARYWDSERYCHWCLQVANIVANNASLVLISLSLNQIIRSGIPIITAILGIVIEHSVTLTDAHHLSALNLLNVYSFLRLVEKQDCAALEERLGWGDLPQKWLRCTCGAQRRDRLGRLTKQHMRAGSDGI